MLREHSSVIEEEEKSESTVPGDMTSAIRCDLGMSPHVNSFLLCMKQRRRKKKQCKFLVWAPVEDEERWTRFLHCELIPSLEAHCCYNP